MRRQDIQAILAAAGSGPKHHLGQNFMIDAFVLAAIVDAAEISHDDIVLEVGPGPGNLTNLLAGRAAAVLAVDVDRAMLQAASRHWADLQNVQWLAADILAKKHEINPVVIDSLRQIRAARGKPGAKIKLVANLPYNVASPLVAELLILHCRQRTAPAPTQFQIDTLVFTVQWEVGRRMAAAAGEADYGALGALIQLLAEVEILRPIAAGCFWPPPKIRSALVRIRPDETRMARIPDALRLQRVITHLFTHRRQNLANTLRHGFKEIPFSKIAGAVTAAGMDLKSRAETLEPQKLLRLVDIISAVENSSAEVDK